MDNDSLIEKWLRGEASREDLDNLKATGELEKLERIDRALANFKAPEYHAEFQRTATAGRRYRSKQIYLGIFRVAAAVLLVMSVYFIFLSDASVVRSTGPAETASIMLPDSSSVILNAESQITYNPDAWHTAREVQLQGEAFFNVMKGSNFDVRTDHGTIRVVGTSFNIRARGSFFEVTCVEGKVAVDRQGEARYLTAGMRYQLINNEISVESTNQTYSSVNPYEESRFEGVPLGEVIDELERHYDIRIQRGNADLERLITTTFTHKDLNTALQTVFIPLDIRYQIDNNDIILNERAE